MVSGQSVDSYATPPSPKWLAARIPKIPIEMWPIRQAIVVTGGGAGSGYSIVDHRVTGTGRLGGGRLCPGPDAPRSRDRLPQVLLVREAIEPRPEVAGPVPVELVDELVGPIDLHD